MSDIEMKIINEEPDFDNQIAILDEEKKLIIKKRKFIALIIGILILIALIFIYAYSNLYFIWERGLIPINNACVDSATLNLTGDQLVPIYKYNDSKYGKIYDVSFKNSIVLNKYVGTKECNVPEFNITYGNYMKAFFNVDIYNLAGSDDPHLFLFNPINQTDENGICIRNCDVNGDNIPDFNIDLNGDGIVDINISKNNKVCDLNCDINFDTIPDINVDIDGDGKADLNVLKDGVIYNQTYKTGKTPTFNVEKNGKIDNKVNQLNDEGKCIKNCDLNNDGIPEYNIDLGNGNLINELIYGKYYNIDVDGDGKPDVNIKTDSGIINPINIEKDLKPYLNIDVNNDGFPDQNIDVDGDGTPDLNVVQDGICIRNCDINNDGKAELNIDYRNDMFDYLKLNVDTDYDGICDVNCDSNNDFLPDYNLDVNGDNLPDLNIKDGDKYFNIDNNNDLQPDENIDLYHLGTYEEDLSINDYELKYKDLNDTQIILDLLSDTKNDFIVNNTIDIIADNIELPRNGQDWQQYYVIYIRNNADFAVNYSLYWESVKNTYQSNNLTYHILKNGNLFLNETKAPTKSITLNNSLIIAPKSTAKFVMKMTLKNLDTNQIIDAGKSFSGKLMIKNN